MDGFPLKWNEGNEGLASPICTGADPLAVKALGDTNLQFGEVGLLSVYRLPNARTPEYILI